MFHPFTYDHQNSALHARFSGTLTERDLADSDLAITQCMQLHGPTAALLDFADVYGVEITTAQFVARGMRPQVICDQRRVMVANGVLYGLLRMFGAYQSHHSREPEIVRTLAEAYAVLGITGDNFQPVEFPVRLVSPLSSKDYTYVHTARAVAPALQVKGAGRHFAN